MVHLQTDQTCSRTEKVLCDRLLIQKNNNNNNKKLKNSGNIFKQCIKVLNC